MYFNNKLYSKVRFTIGLFIALLIVNFTNLHVIIGVKVFYYLAFIYCKVITVDKFGM